MRKTALFGTALTLVLTLSVIVPVLGAPPTTIPPQHPEKGHGRMAPVLTKGMTLTITGSGKAFKISNQSVTDPASISLTATVVRVSPGRAMIDVKSGTLNITLTTGTETFTVVRGQGILNFHSDKMILHVVLKDSAGKQLHMILFGKNAQVPKTFSVNDHFSVDFAEHQSKLAGKFFLEFPTATVMRTS